jgi:endonuclease/exonuclease/phosphatase family metal-dependent hydrolase
MWNRRAVLFALLAGVFGCDRIERETVDRAEDPDPSVWTSRSDCEAVLPDILAEQSKSQTPRIGTWNVRYFPDSQEETQTDPELQTDVPWLACAMASLDVDVLAIQEFKTTPAALEKQDELLARLNELTGGDWEIQVAPCEPKEVQHPGFLFDKTRVTGSNFRELAEMNPDAECTNEASPGFAGYFQLTGGPDFHMIAVHFQAGSTLSAVERRDQAIATMQAVTAEASTLVADTDVFFAGDFNTAGCEDCDPVLSSLDEVAELAATVEAMPTPATLLDASEVCTRQDDASQPLLDHIVVSQSTEEVTPGSVAHVGGLCEALECDRLTNWLEDARDRLSDHCPVTVQLVDADSD